MDRNVEMPSFVSNLTAKKDRVKSFVSTYLGIISKMQINKLQIFS